MTDPLPGLAEVVELAAQVRVDSIWSSTSAGSGHPTCSLSARAITGVATSVGSRP